MHRAAPLVHGAPLRRKAAERVGFEPTEAFASHDFESCRFNRAHAPLRATATGIRLVLLSRGHCQVWKPLRLDSTVAGLYGGRFMSTRIEISSRAPATAG